jgi:hypothetical protein
MLKVAIVGDRHGNLFDGHPPKEGFEKIQLRWN